MRRGSQLESVRLSGNLKPRTMHYTHQPYASGAMACTSQETQWTVPRMGPMTVAAAADASPKHSGGEWFGEPYPTPTPASTHFDLHLTSNGIKAHPTACQSIMHSLTYSHMLSRSCFGPPRLTAKNAKQELNNACQASRLKITKRSLAGRNATLSLVSMTTGKKCVPHQLPLPPRSVGLWQNLN